MTAVTSRLASQIDSLGECEDAGDELGDAGGDGEVPAPEENGVDDLVAVGAAPPLVVQELDGEQYYHGGQEQDCNSKQSCMRTQQQSVMHEDMQQQSVMQEDMQQQAVMHEDMQQQAVMHEDMQQQAVMHEDMLQQTVMHDLNCCFLSVERKGAVVLSTVHACSCWVDKVNYEWAYSFINDFSGKIPAFMLSSC